MQSKGKLFETGKIPSKPKNIMIVPDTVCNFACKYCYLGTSTDKAKKTDIVQDFINYANRLLDQGYYINQVLIHGSEVTALPVEKVDKLLDVIQEYYDTFSYIISFNNTRISNNYVHVKTNAYNLDKFLDTFIKHNVGISCSIDVPFRMHDKYRVHKNGKTTSEKTLHNLKLLIDSGYKYYGLSTTCTQEHIQDIDEFIQDLTTLENMGLDMNNKFYIMFVYDSKATRNNINANMPDQDTMVEFYREINKRLAGTTMELGARLTWFKEFVSGHYCTEALNCGDRLSIHPNGETYICHRNVNGDSRYNTGNIFKNSLQELENIGKQKIQDLENSLDLHPDCLECEHFHRCMVGCPIERLDGGLTKRYTCALQREIYKENPDQFPPDKAQADAKRSQYLWHHKKDRYLTKIQAQVTTELSDLDNSLVNIAMRDDVVRNILDDSNFIITINNEIAYTNSIISSGTYTYKIKETDDIVLHVKKQVFDINIDNRYANCLDLHILHNKMIKYGDEGRTKCEHIYGEQLYYGSIEQDNGREYIPLNLRELLSKFWSNTDKEVTYFLYMSTRALNKYHYELQGKNAFYHIQTVNLPFIHFDFKVDNDVSENK